MKLAKRVLTAILAAAVTTSCIAMSALAADEQYVDVGNVEEVLEYYMCEDYVNQDFDNIDLGATYVVAPKMNCTECGEELVLYRGKWLCAVPVSTASTPYYCCPNPDCSFASKKVTAVYSPADFAFSNSILNCIHTDGIGEGEVRDNICDKCNSVICLHNVNSADGICEICGLEICKHENLDANLKCLDCGIYWHDFSGTNGNCANCSSYTKTQYGCNHTVISTESSQSYGLCSLCYAKPCNHYDNNGDFVCDNAGCNLKLDKKLLLTQDIELKEDGDNKYLQLTDTTGAATTFKLKTSVYDESKGKWTTRQSEKIVVSFRIKFDNYEFYDTTGSVNGGIPLPPEFDTTSGEEPDILNTGALFQLSLTGIKNKANKSVSGTFPFAEIDTSATRTFSFVEYDTTATSVANALKNNLKNVEGKESSLGEWYTVSAVFNFADGYYNVDVLNETTNELVSSGSRTLGDAASANAVVLQLPSNASYAGTTTSFDSVSVYEGTYVRDVSKKVDFATDSIIKLADFIKNDNVKISDKVRIADVFDTLFNGGYYTEADASAGRETEIAAIINEAKTSLINGTYEKAFLSYVDEMENQVGYYVRKAYCENVVSRFADMFDFGDMEDNDIMNAFPGITDLEKIREARNAYSAELEELEVVRIQSEAFMSAIAYFDTTSRDYNYMNDQYMMLTRFTLRDSTYEYAVGEFTTVADAEAKLTALVEKMEAINASASAFVSNVEKMTTAASFKDVNDAYLIAKEIYGDDGVINENLDNSTYAGLEEAIEKYMQGIPSIQFKIEQSEAYIAIVNKAKTSTYYVTILAALDEAAPYIDADTANLHAEPDYVGVAEATADYNALRAKLAADKANAEAYISAVNAIASTQDFASKKAAVETAIALKANGSVIGIDGVSEANVALSEAEAYIKELEGYALTLVNAVANLENATTLAERRENIFIANSCLDKVDKTAAEVIAATAKLQTLIAAYDAEIAALNAAFIGAVKNSGAVSASSAPVAGAYKNADIINNAIK